MKLVLPSRVKLVLALERWRRAGGPPKLNYLVRRYPIFCYLAGETPALPGLRCPGLATGAVKRAAGGLDDASDFSSTPDTGQALAVVNAQPFLARAGFLGSNTVIEQSRFAASSCVV